MLRLTRGQKWEIFSFVAASSIAYFVLFQFDLDGDGVKTMQDYLGTIDEDNSGAVSTVESIQAMYLPAETLVLVLLLFKISTVLMFLHGIFRGYSKLNTIMHRPDYAEGDEKLFKFFATEFTHRHHQSCIGSSFHTPCSGTEKKTNLRKSLKSFGSSEGGDSIESLNEISSKIGSWEFDVFDVAEVTKFPLTFVGFVCLQALDVPTKTGPLVKFLRAVENSYKDVPYHNSLHGAQVSRTMFWYCTEGGLGSHLSQLDQFMLVLAGLVHDVHHPGLTSAFIIKAAEEYQVDFDEKVKRDETDYLGLAVTYNDQSPLENMHLAVTFHLLAKAEHHFIERSTVVRMRRTLVMAVLATDMAFHDHQLTKLQALVDNLKNNDELNPSTVPWYFPHRAPPYPKSLSASEKLEKQNKWLDNMRKEFVMELFLHAADIGSAAMPFEQWCKWNDRVGQEFKHQKELEVEQFGEVISAFLPDYNDKNAVHNFARGFMTFMVEPLFSKLEALASIEHKTCIATNVNIGRCHKQLQTNIALWDKSAPDRLNRADRHHPNEEKQLSR